MTHFNFTFHFLHSFLRRHISITSATHNHLNPPSTHKCTSENPSLVPRSPNFSDAIDGGGGGHPIHCHPRAPGPKVTPLVEQPAMLNQGGHEWREEVLSLRPNSARLSVAAACSNVYVRGNIFKTIWSIDLVFVATYLLWKGRGYKIS